MFSPNRDYVLGDSNYLLDDLEYIQGYAESIFRPADHPECEAVPRLPLSTTGHPSVQIVFRHSP
jgi:hypothetical protein